MNIYIALLRGINVNGAKQIKMDQLRETFKSSGFDNITTYIQSGNMVFTANEINTRFLAEKIVAKIRTDYGFEVPVIVLSAEEVQKINENNPLNDGTKDPGFLHITFLAENPAGFDLKEIESKKQGDEEIVVSGKAVYLYCPHGYGRTKLTNTFLESKLKVTATTRNWKTVVELLKIAKGMRI